MEWNLYEMAGNLLKRERAVFIADIARELDVSPYIAGYLADEMVKNGIATIVDKGVAKLVKWKVD